MASTLWRRALCVLALSLHAEDRTFGPQDLVRALMQSNPEIQAARYRFDAATKKPSQAGTLPEPSVSYTNLGVGHPLSRLNGSEFAYQGFSVSQEFPFPGKLGLAAEQGKREAEGERENYRAVVLDVTARLKLGWFEWLMVQKTTELVQRNIDLLSRFEEIARNRYTVGKGQQQDILKAQFEVSSLQREMLLLEERDQRAQAEIASLLGLPGIRLHAPKSVEPTPFQMSLDELVKEANQSPRVRAEQSMVDVRAVGIDRSRKDFRPDFGVTLQWQHTGGNFPDYYMATVEVKVPVYYARKQRYALEEAYSRLNEAKQNYRAERHRASFRVRDQYLAIQSSEKMLGLYKSTLRPQAQLTLDAAVIAYEAGSIDFLSLVTNLTTLIGLERQYSDEVFRHEEAIVRLESVVAREFVPFSEARQ
ncbi:MAG: uncharacterized protein JWN34_2295 [Bryobacterales bacterium]|jgi:cobalt-zinc-cadmium efflux system outer membrane protein|nr:uncharacterized protein [Bryobacterales bacterium]